MLELFERDQLPTDVGHTMAGSLGGNIRHQQMLFQAMIDTWPRLQKSLGDDDGKRFGCVAHGVLQA